MLLSEASFFVYAATQYKNSMCTGLKEFEEDLARFKYIKRLLNRSEKTGILADRLILNHIILLYNVFGHTIVELLFFKIDKKYWPKIKTFLLFLNYIDTEFQIETPLDSDLVRNLRSI
jgi:hypothetical protein